MTNAADPDAIFEALADSYVQVGDEGVARFQARLILMLINQLGDDAATLDLIRLAAEPQ